MKSKRKLTIESFAVKSFITTDEMDRIQGGSNCCLRDTDVGMPCYTFGHEGDCGSTGTTDNPTGGGFMTELPVLC
ncbi:MAG: hypothetical protein WBA74_10105 [Cyclobacteriaceae bacterium]